MVLPKIRLSVIAFVALVVLIAAVWASGLTNLLSWSVLARQQAVLDSWVAAHRVLAPVLFLAVYVASVALSLPQAGLLTLLGGLLFGTLAGGILAVVAATSGAVVLFLIARSAFAEPLAKRGGAALDKLRGELRRDAFSYLLALRLVPLFPFWLINLAAALCGMRLRPYVAATLIGIMPTTFITASIGAGLGGVLSSGGPPSLRVLFSWPILVPLLALAAVSLMPLIWRKWRARVA